MKKTENFENVYENIRINNESELTSVYEKAKQESKKKNRFTLITCIIIDAIIIYLGLNNPLLKTIAKETEFFILSLFQLLVPILFIDLFTFVIYSIIFSKKTSNYSIIFKNTIIRDLLSYFFTNFTYSPPKALAQNVYNEGEYREYYNRYHSDDHLIGKIDDKYDIEMAEVKTQKVETRRDSKGRTHTTTTTIFSGIFAKINIDKSINTTLKIRRNSSIFNKDRLNMDSQEFEKYFDVSSDNQIIGMQLLTADIMQKLVDFYINTDISFDITINNNLLYLRFHCRRMFEIGNFKEGAIPKNTLNKYYDILKFINELSTLLIDTINITEV